jgi:predicted transcriptional regulator
MATLEKTLADFGLNSAQTKVYLALLRLGETKAAPLAQAAGLKRTSIYESLDQLVALGLARTINKQGATHYAPESPNKLLEILQNREQSVQGILPNLLGLFSTSVSEMPRIQYHEGRAGLVAIYEDILTAKDKYYCYFASFNDETDILGQDYQIDLTLRRIKLGINHHGLRTHESKEDSTWGDLFTKQGPEVLREYRYLPPSVKLPVRVYMYDGKVAIMSMRKESWGLIIHSTELHQALTSLFEFVWAQVPRIPF